MSAIKRLSVWRSHFHGYILSFEQNINILCVSRDKVQPEKIIAAIVNTLQCSGFLISPKSVLSPVQSTSWMGKQIDLLGPKISPRPSALVELLTRSARLAVCPYNQKYFRKFLGKPGLVGRPRILVGWFLAGPRMWLNKGPH